MKAKTKAKRPSPTRNFHPDRPNCILRARVLIGVRPRTTTGSPCQEVLIKDHYKTEYILHPQGFIYRKYPKHLSN